MLLSRLPHLVWPALPGPFHAQVIALLHQFETSQWWQPADLAQQQFRQLAALLAHFQASSPFMRPRLEAFNARLDRRVNATTLRAIPVLTRAEIRAAGDRLFNTDLPPGQVEWRSSGSSGTAGAPVVVRKTEVGEMFHAALGLRNHVWHERDFSGSFAAIRRFPHGTAMGPEGAAGGAWAPGIETGPSFSLNSAFTTLDEQLDWLARIRPAILFSYPSLLHGLALAAERRGMETGWLRGLMGFGEVATPQQRAAITRVFGQSLRDTYSASEVSTIALQCPEAEDSYHVMAENVIVELLDRHGQPCPVGVPGEVVVTDLHNMVTPLIRYAIGDIAEWGPPCPCGRGLPVLRRIVGRTLHLLRLPGGDALVPDIERQDLHLLAPLREVQVVQHGFADIEVRLAMDRLPTADEQAALSAAVRHGLHDRDFALRFTTMAAIPRAESGKFEAFLCAMPPT